MRTADFDQYNCKESRNSPVDMGCHFDAWRSPGAAVGTHDYQVVMAEGFGGSTGNANISVSDANWYTHWTNGGSVNFECTGSGTNPTPDPTGTPTPTGTTGPTETPTPTPTATPVPTVKPTPPPSINPGNGDGLLGEYYKDTNFSNLVLSRIDSVLDMNWGGSSPASSIPEDNFTARWTGKIEARMTETYTIYTQSDDGMRVWINNQQVINDWNDHAAGPDTEARGTISMQMGNRYDIRVEYYENGGDASVQMYWSNPYLSKEIIPQSQLYSGGSTGW